MDNCAFNHIVARIEGWVSSYYHPPGDGSSGVGGPIATYWASSPYVAGPNVMSSYGLIRGLCARAGEGNPGGARLRAENLALYYLRCQDPTTGLFICSWGETPFIGNGLVQQASVVAALWDLQRVWPNNEVAQAAQKGWQACLQDKSIRHFWSVNNQALRGCEALMLGIRARGEERPNRQEAAVLRRTGLQVLRSQWGGDSAVAGAIAQALAHDDIIMPYQGKCLAPLVMLAKSLNEPVYLERAARLAGFIGKNMASAGKGLLQGGHYLAAGPQLTKARRLYRARRIFPILEPQLRRHRQRNIAIWRFNPWPQWVARGLDTARGLYHLGQAMGESHYTQTALNMLQEALRFQTPLGGIRNSLGFFGEDPETSGLTWQDMAPNPRWNSYAVQFLHELAVGTPLLDPILPEKDCRDEVPLAGDLILVETPAALRLVNHDGQTAWHLAKGRRWGRPFRPVCRWNEGAAVTGRLWS